MPTLDFVENAAIWSFAGLLAITGTPLAAIAFLTVAPKFVIAMRTGDLGAVATIYVDGIPAAVADTHSDTPGVIRKIIFGDPDNDTHQVYVQKDDNPDTILEVIRKELSPDEVTPPYIRYNGDCDCTQITTDGGATWTDSPASDPRSNPGQLVPPLSGGSAKCDAAANMVAKLHAMVDQDIASANALLLSSILLDLALLSFPGAGIIADLFLIVGEAIVAIGASAISSSFTTTVYDDLLCTFVDNIGVDGQIDATQFAALNSAVTANYDFIVSTVFNLHSQSLGFVGWSNAGALGTETGDCSACGWCITYDFTTGDGDFAVQFGGTYASGTGWQPTDVSQYRDLEIARTLGGTFHLTEIGMEFDFETGNWDSGLFNSWAIFCGLGSYFDLSDIVDHDDTTNGAGQTLIMTLDDDIDRLYLELVTDTTTGPHVGSATLLNVTIRGTGTKPVLSGWTDC